LRHGRIAKTGRVTGAPRSHKRTWDEKEGAKPTIALLSVGMTIEISVEVNGCDRTGLSVQRLLI
jgi:hypothetical protein